jgi:hypothetical protein
MKITVVIRTISLEGKPDGSAKYTVAAGDNSWSIARDVLKNQGVENLDGNQQANYRNEQQSL